MNKKISRGSLLESILLNLINDTSDRGLNGYAIFKEVDKKFGIRLGPSTLYPELKHLEKQGLVASSWEFALGKARKQYRTTKKGQSLLRRRQQQIMQKAQSLMREYLEELKSVIPAFVTYKS
ncbi:MAG: helix-turn-helix transcriptional regulator [Candidatus Bathyarchaeia archaeon]